MDCLTPEVRLNNLKLSSIFSVKFNMYLKQWSTIVFCFLFFLGLFFSLCLMFQVELNGKVFTCYCVDTFKDKYGHFVENFKPPNLTVNTQQVVSCKPWQ